MAKGNQKTNVGREKNKSQQEIDEASSQSNKEGQSRCLAIAKKGIRTGGQFAELMSALVSDIIEGKITPQVANATVNAGGKLLKVVEMKYKYGVTLPGEPTKEIALLPEPESESEFKKRA